MRALNKGCKLPKELGPFYCEAKQKDKIQANTTPLLNCLQRAFRESRARNFNSFDQNDASEVLMKIIQEIEGVFGPWKALSPKVSNCKTCSLCSASFKSEAYLIPILSPKPSLQESLFEFLGLKNFAFNSTWFCPNCGPSQDYNEEIIPSRAPKMLILQMNRVSAQGRKDTTLVDISSEKLVLPIERKGISILVKYQLSAVICHKGTSTDGHYFTYARHKKVWYLCNDSKVRSISDENMKKTLNSKLSVVYFFKKISD